MAATHIAYIPPGALWENPFVEAFNSRVRDEPLNIDAFGTPTGPTAPLAGSPPQSFASNGPTTKRRSHRQWITFRGPATPRGMGHPPQPLSLVDACR